MNTCQTTHSPRTWQWHNYVEVISRYGYKKIYYFQWSNRGIHFSVSFTMEPMEKLVYLPKHNGLGFKDHEVKEELVFETMESFIGHLDAMEVFKL